MPDDDVDSAASVLCRTCGLCCDGTIFDYVPITKAESLRLMHRLPVLRATAERALHVEQRCVALGPRGCDVYAERPSSCSRFRCNLLRRVDSGETTLPAALEIIEQVLLPATRLDELLPRGKSFHSRRRELAEWGDHMPPELVGRGNEMWADLQLLTELVRRELIDKDEGEDDEEDEPRAAPPSEPVAILP